MPLPTMFIPAVQSAQRLVVVLPGRGDNLRALETSGIAAAIQGAWPDADVILTELAVGYYEAGIGPKTLHEEVILPARLRHYREIWLLGASMGGMGALLYDQAYASSNSEHLGLILLAPYLGERPIREEISAAGGLGSWRPRPTTTIDAQNWQLALWTHIQAWSKDPRAMCNVWLAYGDGDRLRESMPMLAGTLAPEHVLVRKGGHAWSVWTPAAADILGRIGGSSERCIKVVVD